MENEAPTITSAASVSVPEIATAVMTVTATDPDGDNDMEWYYKLYNPWGNEYEYVHTDLLTDLFKSFRILNSL